MGLGDNDHIHKSKQTYASIILAQFTIYIDQKKTRKREYNHELPDAAVRSWNRKGKSEAEASDDRRRITTELGWDREAQQSVVRLSTVDCRLTVEGRKEERPPQRSAGYM